MSEKTPSETRRNLETSRDRIANLICLLERHAEHVRSGLEEECREAARELNLLLDNNPIPTDYKVAVVGRFKAGKSRFVNALLERRLAGVDTSPETAAVTTFRHGWSTSATVRFLTSEEWRELNEIYADNPRDPQAHRVAIWKRFAADPISKDGQAPEIYDLSALAAEFIRDNRHSIKITLPNYEKLEERRKAESEFHRQVKRYTSGSKPFHCLVEAIEIETPSKLLAEGVTLVDTPGLDDTERFRVQLTEDAVQDIDAVLFLTKSGASYGQSEKEFVLSLLRKGKIKQFLLIVTQVDQTYKQHIDQAGDQDEDAEPLADRIAAERRRITRELHETLDELEGELGGAVPERYREQLTGVNIGFTSATLHDDFINNRVLAFSITPGDPGGFVETQRKLFQMLAKDSRMAMSAATLRDDAVKLLNEILRRIENRAAIVAQPKGREIASRKLESFAADFSGIAHPFLKTISEERDKLTDALRDRKTNERRVIDEIGRQATAVLSTYEDKDIALHWQTRRSGKWGFLTQIQGRIANRVFPLVTRELESKTTCLFNYMTIVAREISKLGEKASDALTTYEIDGDFRLNLEATMASFLTSTKIEQNRWVESEEAEIVSVLDEFVDANVRYKLDNARRKVAEIVGKGTKLQQDLSVHVYYEEIRALLKKAIEDYALHRFTEYAEHLVERSQGIDKRATAAIDSEIRSAITSVKAAVEIAADQQREAIIAAWATLRGAIESARGALLENSDPRPRDSQQIPETKLLRRLVLSHGARGWPWSRILDEREIANAKEAWLVDPYLSSPHQRRNLRELLEHMLSSSRIRIVHLLTKELSMRGLDADIQYFQALDALLFKTHTATLICDWSEDIHDRSLRTDNGLLLKFGRGLDIYQFATGLAAREPGLRAVKACEIDVFGPAAAERGLASRMGVQAPVSANAT